MWPSPAGSICNTSGPASSPPLPDTKLKTYQVYPKLYKFYPSFTFVFNKAYFYLFLFSEQKVLWKKSTSALNWFPIHHANNNCNLLYMREGPVYRTRTQNESEFELEQVFRKNKNLSSFYACISQIKKHCQVISVFLHFENF